MKMILNMRLHLASCFLGLIVALSSHSALANTKYFVIDNTGPTWPKYPTGADACLVLKSFVQTSADEVNPGGITIVKQWPDEGTAPNLKNSTPCVVNWSRTVNGIFSSFDYHYFLYAGLCNVGQIIDSNIMQCVGYSVSILSSPKLQCGSCVQNYLKDPINPATGAVFDSISDTASSRLSFKRFYSSTDTGGANLSTGWERSYARKVVTQYSTIATQDYLVSGNTSSQYADPGAACVGGFAEIKAKIRQWNNAISSYSNGNCVLTKNGAYVGSVTVNVSAGSFAPAPTPVAYDVIRDDGQLIRFIIDGNGTIISPSGIGIKLQKTTSGFTVTDGNDNVEQYDTNGKLLTVTSRSGVVQTMNYDGSGRLSGVSDSFGHQLNFSYDAQGHLSTGTQR